MGKGEVALANLRRFLTYTVAATGGLETLADRFGVFGGGFAALAGQAETERKAGREQMDDLVDDAFVQGFGRVQDTIESLGEAAGGGQAAVEAASEALDRAAAELHDEAEMVLTRLSVAQARLATEGFTALDARLDASGLELAAAEQALQQTYDAFEASLAAGSTEAASALGDAASGLEETATLLARDGAALEAAVADALQGLDAVGDALEPLCAALTSDVGAFYDALDAAVAEQGQEWQEYASGLAAEASAFAATAAEEHLAQPLRLVEDGAFAALEQEYASLGTALDEGRALAADLEPLVGELAACLQVVARVAELLDALTQ